MAHHPAIPPAHQWSSHHREATQSARWCREPWISGFRFTAPARRTAGSQQADPIIVFLQSVVNRFVHLRELAENNLRQFDLKGFKIFPQLFERSAGPTIDRL